MVRVRAAGDRARYLGRTGTRSILFVGLVVAITASVALAGDAGARYESGGIANGAEAIAAVKPFLPVGADAWRITRVTLAKQASEFEAVSPQTPASGLTRHGFPCPVWVVTVSASLLCDATPPKPRRAWPTQLVYGLEASNGEPLTRSGIVCGPPAGLGFA